MWGMQISSIYHRVCYDDFVILQKLSSTRQNEKQKVPFSTLAQFGAGTIAILSVFIALSLLLFDVRFFDLAIFFVLLAIAIFCVKSFEVIEFGEAREKKLIDQRCLVVKKIAPNERGIVKVYRDDAKLDPELWSVESVTIGAETGENQTAIVVGMRSVVLSIEPQ